MSCVFLLTNFIIMNRLNFTKFQNQFNIYSFIWQIIRIRWFTFSMLIVINVATEAANTFYTQYFNRSLINGASTGNMGLKLGIFYILMYAIFQNTNKLTSPIVNKLQFDSLSRIKNNLRNNLYGYTIQHSMNYFNNNFSGVLNNKIKSIVKNSGSLIELSIKFLSLALVIVLTPIIYAQINIYMGLAFIIISIFYLFLLIKMRKKHKEKVKVMTEAKNRYFGLINDDFTNITNIKGFANERNEIRNVKRINNQILRAAYEFLKMMVLANTIGLIFRFGFMFCITGIGGYMLALHKINIGDFMFITIIAAIMKWVLDELAKIIVDFVLMAGQIENDIKTIIRPPEITNKSQKQLSINNGKIVFKNVYFGYKREDIQK